jgi:hypothetical protein
MNRQKERHLKTLENPMRIKMAVTAKGMRATQVGKPTRAEEEAMRREWDRRDELLMKERLAKLKRRDSMRGVQYTNQSCQWTPKMGAVTYGMRCVLGSVLTAILAVGSMVAQGLLRLLMCLMRYVMSLINEILFYVLARIILLGLCYILIMHLMNGCQIAWPQSIRFQFGGTNNILPISMN